MKCGVIQTLLFSLALMASLPLAATEVHASLDRDSVHLGDTVTLTLSVADAANAETPDFSVLVPDFVLAGTSRDQSINISNGQVSKTVRFGVALRARHAGKITIPAFTVAGSNSQPLALTVLPADNRASGTPGDPVFVRADIEPQKLYVGQQAHLSIKLYYTGGSLQGKLDEPGAADADVQRLGKESQFQSQQGGRMYRVVERNYSFIPRKPGELMIPPVGFRGQMVTGANSYFGNSESVSAQSPAVQLDVRAKAAGSGSGPWLPARSLSLSMQGVPSDGKASVGTPITVTITEKASGLGYESLPEPSLPSIDGAEVYPDKSQNQNGNDGQWIEGTRVRKFAVVPTQPGNLSIPAIAVDWWNVHTDQPETASATARTLDVSGDQVASTHIAPPSPTTGANTTLPALSPTEILVKPAEHTLWRWLALVALALWLLTALLWAVIAYRRRQDRKSPTADTQVLSVAAQRRAFRQTSDAASQSRSLLAWAQAERPGVRNLSQLATQLDDTGQCRVLEGLERARYTEAFDAPDPTAVRKAFAKGFVWREAAGKQDKVVLPPLYPKHK